MYKENTFEFLDQCFCPNCNWSPPHACDFTDIFMGELDEKKVEGMEDNGVENTGWTLYRDDGWLEEIPIIEDILQNLHPNIKWEVDPREPSIQPIISPDLSIHIVDHQLETRFIRQRHTN